MEPLSIKVIAGSTREGRFSDTPAQWIVGELGKHGGVTAEVLDLRDYQMPFFDSAATPTAKTEPYQNEAVARFTQKITEGDAFVFVTPEYNHSTSGVLKNALDWVYQEWNDKPVGFVAYGSAGGARAVEHLRQIAVELQMASVREAVHITGSDFFPVHFGGNEAGPMLAKYEEKAGTMIEQLTRWARAFKQVRTG